jgi:hypothetical protein
VSRFLVLFVVEADDLQGATEQAVRYLWIPGAGGCADFRVTEQGGAQAVVMVNLDDINTATRLEPTSWKGGSS